jgi:hypothetical protein
MSLSWRDWNAVVKDVKSGTLKKLDLGCIKISATARLALFHALRSKTSCVTEFAFMLCFEIVPILWRTLTHPDCKITTLTLYMPFRNCNHSKYKPLWTRIALGKTSVRSISIEPDRSTLMFIIEEENGPGSDFCDIFVNPNSTLSSFSVETPDSWQYKNVIQVLDTSVSKLSKFSVKGNLWPFPDTHKTHHRVVNKIRKRGALLALLASRLPPKERIQRPTVARLPNELLMVLGTFLVSPRNDA